MPQQPVTSPLFSAQPDHALPEVDAALQRFWDVVRRTAEAMVTLRQDNASLVAEVSRLTNLVDDLTAQLDVARATQNAPVRHEREQELLDQLAIASTEYERFREAAEAVSRQRDTLAEEREALAAELTTLAAERDALKADVEAGRAQQETSTTRTEPSFEAADTHELLMNRIAELEHTVAEYKAKAVLGTSDSMHDGQMSLFGPAPTALTDKGASATTTSVHLQGLTGNELRAIAARLDSVADRIGGLFGIS